MSITSTALSLNAHSQVLARELINDVTDIQDRRPFQSESNWKSMAHTCPGALALDRCYRCGAARGLEALRASHTQPFGAPQAPERITPHDNRQFWPAPRHVCSPTVDAWRQNRSSTGAQAHDHAAFSTPPTARTPATRDRDRPSNAPAQDAGGSLADKVVHSVVPARQPRSFPPPPRAALPYPTRLGLATV